MNVSVVICAYTEERWDDVLAAVASVRGQRLAPHEIIVVVDHNPALLHRLRGALPDVMVVPNTGPCGLSGGKNTGVAAACGDVVAFLDDDAVAEPGWLAVLSAGYATPDVAGVGGRTLPLWASAAPRWFPDEFAWVVGCTYEGLTAGPVRNLMGGNASFRRAAFDVARGFRSGIGRAPGKRPLGCEETEFCIRLRQAAPDTVLLFDDRAVIWHRVPAARARFAYFRARCYAEGLSKAMVTRSVGVGDGLASERRHALVALPRGIGRGLRAAVTGDPAGLGRATSIVAGLTFTTAGYAVGSLARGRGRERPGGATDASAPDRNAPAPGHDAPGRAPDGSATGGTGGARRTISAAPTPGAADTPGTAVTTRTPAPGRNRAGQAAGEPHPDRYRGLSGHAATRARAGGRGGSPQAPGPRREDP